MHNEELRKQSDKILKLVQDAEAFDESDEMRSHVAKYVCILCSGFLENAVHYIYSDYVKKETTSAGVISFATTVLSYTTEYNRNVGIDSVKSNSPYDIRYKKSTSTGGQPYFTLHAANNQVIGTSEMYSSSAARDNGIEAVKKAAPNAITE